MLPCRLRSYTNVLIGVVAVVSRVTFLLGFFFLYMQRLDKSSMPGPEGNSVGIRSCRAMPEWCASRA